MSLKGPKIGLRQQEKAEESGCFQPLARRLFLGGDGGGGGSRFDQLGDALGELCALGDPVVDAFALEVDGGGVGAGIVGAYNLDRTAIAGRRAFQ